MLNCTKSIRLSSSFIICISYVFATNYLYQLKPVVLLITWGKSRCPGLTHWVNACAEKGGDRACTHRQASENVFTAISSLLHQPTGSGGSCSDLAMKLHVYPLHSGKNLSYNFFPLKLHSQKQPSRKKNVTDHSGGHQRTMSWSLSSFSEES